MLTRPAWEVKIRRALGAGRWWGSSLPLLKKEERSDEVIELGKLKNRSAVQSRYFDLTVLTPLFMHGWQESRQSKSVKIVTSPVSAEVRVPSIKGVLRYW